MGFGSSLACDISMNTRLSADERKHYQDPEIIREVLHGMHHIALVGLSDKKERPSNFVGSYLKTYGYNVIPVNPLIPEALGLKSYPDLKSVPFPVDIVDIFRRPDECVNIVREAIAIKAKVIWMQLGVVNREAAELARSAGMKVIMDRCMKIEHGRYTGHLHWAGMNTEIITARKAERYI
jgi:predicted CoA-binding protein